MKKANIGILCSGGDVSGMNPAIKRFVEYAKFNNLIPYFIYDGYEGLIDNKIAKASYKDVAGIINRGGTIIGSARSKRFLEKSYRAQAYKNLKKCKIEQLVVLGGDGSFRGMDLFSQEHAIKFVAIPSTIDNDIYGTDYCLGVDTALNIIKYSIDAIRDTASSFQRAFVIETMGNKCGYLALVSYVTSGAEMCLIPEVPYKLKRYKKQFHKEIQEGRRYFIALVSEGIQQDTAEIAQWFEDEFNIESRVSVLGHIQRGGNPSSYDRLMAYEFVTRAIDALQNNQQNSVICYTQQGFCSKTIDEVTSKKKTLSPELLRYLHEIA